MRTILPALNPTGDICARSSRVGIVSGEANTDASFEDELAAALLMQEAIDEI